MILAFAVASAANLRGKGGKATARQKSKWWTERKQHAASREVGDEDAAAFNTIGTMLNALPHTHAQAH